MNPILFLVMLMCVIPAQAIYAVQLDAVILNSQSTFEPSFKFLRVLYIEYPDGGNLKDLLEGKNSEISFTADKETPGVKKLIEQINQDLKDSKSRAIVTDLTLQYHATISANQKSTTVEYDIKMNPKVSGYASSNDVKVLVDSKWRGFSIEEPILIETEHGIFDLNSPKSALLAASPQAVKVLDGTSARNILEMPLINTSGLDMPLAKWHYLFDPTGQQVESQNIGYKEKGIFSRFSMGECNISTGVCNDREWKEEVILDKRYTIRAIESQDDATLAIQGYVSIETIDGIESFVVNQAGDSVQRRINEFPAGIIYGMTALAAIGAVVFFVFSSKKLKKETETGQTGIDPSLLQVQETSNSAGSYKTNRGEAHLLPSRENSSGFQKSPVRYD